MSLSFWVSSCVLVFCMRARYIRISAAIDSTTAIMMNGLLIRSRRSPVQVW